jgi:hypothetical protein
LLSLRVGCCRLVAGGSPPVRRLWAADAIRTFRRRGLGQLIQIDLPDAHQTKRGTPTMGGAVIILGAVAGYLVVHLFSRGRVPYTPAGHLPGTSRLVGDRKGTGERGCASGGIRTPTGCPTGT